MVRQVIHWSFVFPGLLLTAGWALPGCTPGELWEGSLPGDCSDGADNDLDGFFDCNDPGCEGAPVCTDPPLSDAFELGPQIECLDPFQGIDRFTELSAERGLNVLVGAPHGDGGEGSQTAQGGALVVQDLDLDGDFDILQGPKTIYVNDGTGHFTYVPGPIAENMPGSSGYMAVADLDGDGLPELIGDWTEDFSIRPRLWDNLGEMNFTQVQQFQVPDNNQDVINPTVTLGDIDQDGDLDMAYITGGFNGEINGSFPTSIYRYDSDTGRYDHWIDLRYDGTRDVSSQVALFLDHDSDGDQDLYIPNDWVELQLPSALWRNDGLEDDGMPRLVEYGAAVYADLDMVAMGIDSADINFDGRLDFCMTDVGPPRCLRSLGDGSYADVGQSIGMYPTGSSQWDAISTVGWSFDFADLDNDGWVDAVQPTAPDSRAREMGFLEFRDVLWQGQPDGRFSDVSELSGFDELADHFGMATADLDGDGYLDIVTAGPGTAPSLFMNQCGAEAWLEVEFLGPPANSEGFGTQVQVDVGERVHLRELHGLRATGQGPSRLHFGLGDLDVVPRITIIWPDGEVLEGHDIGTRRVVTVRHSGALP
jgi:hypothetical protein